MRVNLGSVHSTVIDWNIDSGFLCHHAVILNEMISKHNSNERVSRVPFHVKHAQLHLSSAYKTPKTACVQTIMLKHLTNQ